MGSNGEKSDLIFLRHMISDSDRAGKKSGKMRTLIRTFVGLPPPLKPHLTNFLKHLNSWNEFGVGSNIPSPEPPPDHTNATTGSPGQTTM